MAPQDEALLGGGEAADAGAGEPHAKRPRCDEVPAEVVEVDGSVLEGGGQILRMASAYAALFKVRVRIAKIRAGRSKPGLAAQHLESLRLVRDVCGGTLANDQVGSCEVGLTPGSLAPGRFSADPGTAGAITLMVQAALLPLLYTGGSCTCELRGGTDVAYSPPLDFLRGVIVPVFGRMGAVFSVECLSRGFFPRGGGHVRLDVFRPSGRTLKAIDLSERGEAVLARCMLYATQHLGAEEQAAVEAVRGALAPRLAPVADVSFSAAPGPDNKAKYWVDVLVETSTGALFHHSLEPKDLPYTGWGGGRPRAAPLRGAADLFLRAASQVADKLVAQLESGAAVDEHLCDQLVLPASLAEGTTRLLTGQLSLHTRTALHVAGLLVPQFAFREEKRGELTLLEIDGIAHPIPGGEDLPKPAEVAPEVEAAPPAAAILEEAPVALSEPSSAASPVPAAPPMPPEPEPESAAVLPPPPAAAAAAEAAEPEPVGPDQEVLRLRPGALSNAAAELLKDFRNDMGELAAEVGITVEVDVPNNRLVLQGGREARDGARTSLQEVLDFYFPAGPAPG